MYLKYKKSMLVLCQQDKNVYEFDRKRVRQIDRERDKHRKIGTEGDRDSKFIK